MAAPWSKMAGDLDQNPKIREGGRNAREVYLFLLRRNCTLDASGTLPVSNIKPRYLADQLMCSVSDAQDGVDRAVDADLIRVDRDSVVILGWDDEWGRRPLTEAERKRIQRSKPARTEGVLSGHVQTCPDTVRTQKSCPDAVPSELDSPECHAGEEREEREEKHREPGKPGGLALEFGTAPEPVGTPAEALARVACAEINRLTGSAFRPDSEATAKLCRALAKSGHTPDDVLLVVRDKHAEWSPNPEMRKRIVPSTLLALANFAKYLDELRSRPSSSHGVRAPPLPRSSEPVVLNFMGGLEPV